MTFKVTSNLPGVKAQIRDGIARNLEAAARAWQGGIVKTLSGTRSGRFYRVPGTRRTYQASAPDEAPASASGRLRTSIDIKRDGDSFIVGTPVKYSLFLERGTSKMRKRPFIRPGFNKVRGAVEALMKRKIG